MSSKLWSVTCVLCGVSRHEPAPRQGAFGELLRGEGWRRDRRVGWVCPKHPQKGGLDPGRSLADLKPRLQELVDQATPGILKVTTDAYPEGQHATWWIEKERGAGGRGAIGTVYGPIGAPQRQLVANAHLFALARTAIQLLLEENARLEERLAELQQEQDKEGPCSL